jgi:hypothetical protein
MAIAYDSFVDFSEEDASTPTSTAAWTIAATADRFALAAMFTRDFGTPATHNGMTLEGVSMTQLGSTADIEEDTSGLVSRWRLINPGSGASQTLAGALSTTQAVGLIGCAVYNGVDQTTPISSTPTPTEGAWDTVTSVVPSITGTTVTGGKLLVVLALRRSDTTAPSITPGTGVSVRVEEHNNLESLYILEKDNTGGSTTINPSITFPSSSGTWRMDGYAIQASASGTSITAGLGQLALAGFAPTLAATANWAISSGLGQLVLSGQVPTLAATANNFVTAGLGQLVFTGFAPTLAATGNQAVSAGLGELTFTGFAPTIAASGNQAITAGLAALIFTGYAPVQTLTLPSPEPGQLVLTGYAPTLAIASSQSITAGLGALVITGFAPSLAATGNQFVSTDLAQLLFTGLAPTLAATGHQFSVPDLGQLVITGFAPSLTQAGSFVALPDVGQLVITGFAPDVDGGSTKKHAGSRRKTYVIRNRRFKALTREEVADLLATEYIDAVRDEVKVAYRNRVPVKVTQTAWKQIKKSPDLRAIDDDEELLLLL